MDAAKPASATLGIAVYVDIFRTTGFMLNELPFPRDPRSALEKDHGQPGTRRRREKGDRAIRTCGRATQAGKRNKSST